MGSQSCKNHDFCIILYESSLGRSNEMASQSCKNHIFCIILYESGFGRSNEMNSQSCKNHVFCIILYESNLGRSNEMDSQRCKNHDFCIVLYEPSLGRSNSNWHGIVIKTMFFTSIWYILSFKGASNIECERAQNSVFYNGFAVFSLRFQAIE